MERLADPRLVRVCQIAIGLLFAWAALAKVGDVAGFARQVHNFRSVPVATENLVAMTLPWIELVAALALILGLRARAAALVVLVLLATFTLAIAVALARGLSIECGCLGKADASQIGLTKILQNLGLLAVAAIASLRARR